ncbi:MAG: sugar transferase [Christensenellales bacterium]|jgi:undecaprenyl phosphate N,N'-diacetylbacillosamine 1-phosphate transferase
MQSKKSIYPRIKRGLDVALALLLLAVTLPFFPLMALIIRLDSPGKALFSQWRVGKDHKLIKVYKLRTMYTGAEPFAHLLKEPGEIFASREDDPRITRVGRVLRKLSLDELPQLVNVLKGEMSFVGPRPLVLAEMNKMPKIALERLNVRPGLTGFAQVEDREGKPEERLARDLWYVRNMCFFVDLRIVFYTAMEMLGFHRNRQEALARSRQSESR